MPNDKSKKKPDVTRSTEGLINGLRSGDQRAFAQVSANVSPKEWNIILANIGFQGQAGTAQAPSTPPVSAPSSSPETPLPPDKTTGTPIRTSSGIGQRTSVSEESSGKSLPQSPDTRNVFARLLDNLSATGRQEAKIGSMPTLVNKGDVLNMATQGPSSIPTVIKSMAGTIANDSALQKESFLRLVQNLYRSGLKKFNLTQPTGEEEFFTQMRTRMPETTTSETFGKKTRQQVAQSSGMTIKYANGYFKLINGKLERIISPSQEDVQNAIGL